MTVTVDRYTRFLLTVIAVLLTVVAVGLWFETPNAIPTAQAAAGEQLNPGKQLNDIAKNTEQFVVTLNELQKLLVSGSVKVMVVDKTDNNLTTGNTPLITKNNIK